jgi:glutathione S-transferase
VRCNNQHKKARMKIFVFPTALPEKISTPVATRAQHKIGSESEPNREFGVMKIYGFPISPFVRKVMVACAEKGLDAEIVLANPAQPTDEFRKCSPYSKIPAFEDGDYRLADSTAIVTYLEAKHPEPALLPADPRARGKAIWFEEVADTVLTPAAGPIIFNRFVGPKFLGLEGDEAAAVEGEKQLADKLCYMEEVAPADGWLAGEFSIGDISIACVIRTLAYPGWQLDAAKFPALAAWYGRVTERPGWKAAAEQENAIMSAAAG